MLVMNLMIKCRSWTNFGWNKHKTCEYNVSFIRYKCNSEQSTNNKAPGLLNSKSCIKLALVDYACLASSPMPLYGIC